VVGNVLQVFESLKQHHLRVVVRVYHCILHFTLVETLYVMVVWRSHRRVCCGMRNEHNICV
jgi:hypothetical protein